MALVSLRQLLDHAAENSYGVPAFNINNMEQMLSIMEAAKRCDAPVIMQASRGARKYANDIVLTHLIRAAVEMYPEVPVCMHQDHGNSLETCSSAIAAEFSSVMMDGSLMEDGKTPASYEYNVDITKAVVDAAHAVGVSVEGELGCLGSLETGEGDKEDGHGFEGKLDKEMLLTDPEQAKDFVAQTGVDALAIAIGTSHGAYKFTRKPTGDILAMDRLAEIHAAIPNTHLVMHGSSSVPQDLQDIINAHGGEMKQTYGVPVEEIVKGIQHGVRKVNIDTDNRMAITGAIRKVFQDNPSAFDPRAYLNPAMAAMTEVCIKRYEAFNTAGHASKIKVVPLDEMARGYRG
ncbi:MAG: fructose-bisphosphate aldolase class II [Planctomycetes bacterium]|mgnify:CR=1 FL=1|jgi:fructose-bisphosphate aldolase class II|nr:fructose-bisphosphate aldolase class II [Planctomycetota bacterium]MBT4029768.1 fructose-bisphosphate aldolase class II [Planctomycetota bacterium]MBT4559841.1 fructose-bisphosphate aldolase class II [Planctomycetota bacterium]MBT5102381.1 fructose-bisphosphate aldolase class II [Planctomycetota bacterium]MBT5119345.1 fructose-bisphosphate aldolase class II [Planctomycetota bacterium]